MARLTRNAATLVLSLAALAARAQQPCAVDAQKLCQGIPPGDGRVFFCLKSNWDNLSDGCKQLISWSQQRANDVGLDCQGDAFAWCQGVPEGQGRLFSCLMSHRDNISSQCKDALTRVQEFNTGCAGDVARLCPGLPTGQGAVLACLLTQRDKLSAACRAVFWP